MPRVSDSMLIGSAQGQYPIIFAQCWSEGMQTVPSHDEHEPRVL